MALAFTRQELLTIDRSVAPPASSIRRGGYVLAEAEGAAVTFVASGSEVGLALLARDALAAEAW